MDDSNLKICRKADNRQRDDDVRSSAHGYASRQYCEALAEFGRPRFLPGSGAWILERPVNGAGAHDAMGCYPLFTCRNWEALPGDLARLESQLVSLAAVIDPLAEFRIEVLRRSFPDVLIPFKEHFVVDLSVAPEKTASAHHRRYARTSSRAAQIFRAENPLDFHQDWCKLYRILIERHGITGLRAFSEQSFRKQLTVPGVHLFCARHDDQTLGVQIWFCQGERAYYHLGASSAEGYRLRVSYGLMWQALHYFREAGVQQLDLGGGAGLDNGRDGLTRFKQGWSNTTRTAYFAGRILDAPRYRALRREAGSETGNYFPAYRYGEFKRGKVI